MRLKELRTKKNLYQKDIAAMLGIDRTTYAKYETGDSEPNIEMLLKITEIFDVSTDYLLGKKQQEKPTPVFENGPALDKSLVDRLIQLSPEEQKMVEAFVQGMIAERSTNGT